jgi:hypothetical protein
MAVLQSTNVQGTLCVNGVAVGGGKDFKYCCFTSSTTFTPSQDLVDGDGVIDTTLIGGGGGGGNSMAGFLLVNTTQFNTAPSDVTTGAGASGGGGSVGNFITNISSTGACTVTVGAGGLRDVSGTATHMSTSYRCTTFDCGDFRTDPDNFGADGTGGETSFGGSTAYGGGGGASCLRVCICANSGGNTGIVDNLIGASRNGSDSTSCVGGGMERNDDKLAMTSFRDGNNYPLGCGKFWQNDRDGNWGAAYSASVSESNSTGYGFYPKQKRGITISATANCNLGDRNSNCEYEWSANNGIILGDGRRAGTNHCSYFDYQPACQGSFPNYNRADLFNGMCQCIRSGSKSLNCGGGGAPANCATAYVINDGGFGGNWLNTTQGNEGGDGLVVLKWYE